MKRLYKSEKDRMLCGVCAGVAEYFAIDPTLVRIGVVLLSLCSFGCGVLAYFITAVIVPTESRVQGMGQHD